MPVQISNITAINGSSVFSIPEGSNIDLRAQNITAINTDHILLERRRLSDVLEHLGLHPETPEHVVDGLLALLKNLDSQSSPAVEEAVTKSKIEKYLASGKTVADLVLSIVKLAQAAGT